MKIVGREFKAMLDPTRFADQEAAVESFWEELEDLARTTTVQTAGRFNKAENRQITFLDTPDLSMRRNGLVLRRRSGDDSDEYTLKCRSEDRYVAAGTDMGAVQGLDPKPKLEEDIAPPFRCRFSHSNTVTLSGNPPGSLGEVAAVFPLVRTLDHDGRLLAADIPVRPVHKMTAFERVHTGAQLVFDGLGPNGNDENASVALIVWTSGKSRRPLVSEFSFRIKDKEERFSRGLAIAARSFFEVVQRHDWCRPGALTKTEFIYRDTRGD